MKVSALRTLLLGTLFVIVVMAIYFALIPSTYFLRDRHRQKNQTYYLKKSKDGFSAQLSEHLQNNSSRTKDTVLYMAQDDTKTLVQAAAGIFQKRGVVLFTMINDAYFDFAASWCCNTATLGEVHEHVLFLTTDMQTGQHLKTLWPNLTVVSFNSLQFTGAQEYSKAGYVRMMAARTRFILHLLEAGVRLLLFEVDCLWLSDPVPFLLSWQSEDDILATKVTGQDVTAGGFLLINPTNASVKLWQQLTYLMDNLHKKLKQKMASVPVSESLNDQQFFSSLVKSRYAGIKVGYLPAKLFPDGKWYQLPEHARSAKPQPVIINNNWVLGDAAKIRRAKAFGHWFWNEDSGVCNATALHNLYHKQGLNSL